MTRVMGSIVLVLLGLAAAVQYNDPDPFRWMLFYGLGALLGGLGIVRRLWWRHAAGFALLATGVGVAHCIAGADALDANWVESEWVREGFGALISAVLVGVLAWLRYKEAPDQANPYLNRPTDADL
jgi:hypothetical protein